MYSKIPAYIFGFHGCHESVYKRVIYDNKPMIKSTNNYDWLGHGIYFWENSYERAAEWAYSRYGKDGKVIGAFIDLGYCLDLTDYECIHTIKRGYDILVDLCKALNLDIPKNKSGGSKTDILVRNLDCAVIQQVHENNNISGLKEYDSVRGMFTEGKEIFPGSEIKEKTHVQVCIINPNCIKGLFVPKEADLKYDLP
ncbi:MAG: hypothetical protein IJA34_01540 [Lachnospiraceae bacterium]|nr:hypothetical protein [Lachnospiraceae bacterium]